MNDLIKNTTAQISFLCYDRLSSNSFQVLVGQDTHKTAKYIIQIFLIL